MLHRYLVTELLKLRRSLALLLCVAAPGCVAILNVLIALQHEGPAPMPMFGLGAAALWAFAMLPLSITALSVLIAQVEHGPGTWDHLLTLPGARPRVYLAKAIVMMILVAAMSALLLAMVVFSAPLVARLHEVEGILDARKLAGSFGRMSVAALLVCMLQLWVALRYRSFVPPLVFGIAGTFVAVAATGAQQGAYFPWLMAVNVLSDDPAKLHMAILLGGFGGLAALVAMLVHLGLREG